MDILGYLHAEPERPLARVRDPDPGGERPTASEVLDLLPTGRKAYFRKRRWLKTCREQVSNRVGMGKLAKQARKFNISGRAVTADDLMMMPTRGRRRNTLNVRVKGKGK